MTNKTFFPWRCKKTYSVSKMIYGGSTRSRIGKKYCNFICRGAWYTHKFSSAKSRGADSSIVFFSVSGNVKLEHFPQNAEKSKCSDKESQSFPSLLVRRDQSVGFTTSFAQHFAHNSTKPWCEHWFFFLFLYTSQLLRLLVFFYLMSAECIKNMHQSFF